MEETHNKSKTAVRRKEKLKERSLKKKQAKKGDVYEEVRIVLPSIFVNLLEVACVFKCTCNCFISSILFNFNL